MLFLGVVLGVVFILLIIAAPYVVKKIFQSESFFGYCIGVCCWVITVLVHLIILIVESIIAYKYLKESGIEGFSINSLSALTDPAFLFKLGLGMRLVLWIFTGIFTIARFVVLYFYLNKIIPSEYQCYVIYMFVSGYILCYIYNYLMDIGFSIGFSFLSGMVATATETGGKVVDEVSAWAIVKVELEQFLEIIFLSGVAILLFLFRKKLSSMLIWIGLACYFGPMIFELIGILFTVNVFYTHIKYISYLAAPALGGFFYCKLVNQAASPGENYAQV